MINIYKEGAIVNGEMATTLNNGLDAVDHLRLKTEVTQEDEESNEGPQVNFPSATNKHKKTISYGG